MIDFIVKAYRPPLQPAEFFYLQSQPFKTEAAAQKELARLRKNELRWVPTKERRPTKDDTDENGFVLVIETTTEGERYVDTCQYYYVTDDRFTYWLAMPELPKGRGEDDERIEG